MKRLVDYEPILAPLMRFMARETHFDCQPGLSEVLKNNDRLVIVFNHSTPLSWLPAAGLLLVHACARGGENRLPVAVMDRLFFEFPLFRSIAKFMTQSERPLSLYELHEHVDTMGFTDVVIFPEGSNCFFGHPDEIQEFRSPKFIELAVRANIPILVCAHRGSESWARAVRVESEWLSYLDLLPKVAFDFLEKRLKQKGLFTLPLLPKPMELFQMHCELYKPEVSWEDLAHEPKIRYEQLCGEAEKVRLLMKSLLVRMGMTQEPCPASRPMKQEKSLFEN